MPQFENIETRVLIETLAEYTEKFAQLFRLHKRINPSREYLRCKYTIEAILNALNKRKGVVKQEKETYIARYEEVCLSGL
jgi:glycyl-tRNA synthetase alpha subunit